MGLDQICVYSDDSSIEVMDVLTGATLSSTKLSNPIGHNCLSLLGSDYLVYAENDSPIIHFKPLKSCSSDRPVKVICPGKISCLATTPDALFCIVAISDKCYIWHVQSGDVVAILSKHCQPITVIKTSRSGSFFVTAGKDGFVLLWDMSLIIKSKSFLTGASEETPLHSWSNHQALISDVTFGSLETKVASCSIDKTCQIYDILSGDQVAVIYYPTPISSVTMDPLGYFLFAGGHNGIIYEAKLHEKQPTPSEHLPRKSKDAHPLYMGHKERVSCLEISVDGLALFSSSHDCRLKLWNVIAKHCVRTSTVKGPVTNLFSATTCHGFLPRTSLGSRTAVSSTFKRHTVPFEPSSVNEWIDSLGVKDRKKKSGEENCIDRMMKRRSTGIHTDEVETETDLLSEVKKLKQINERMFRYSVDELFKNFSSKI